MRKSEIEVGATYTNRGAGLTRRKVLSIGEYVHPGMLFKRPRGIPDEPVVEYEQNEQKDRVYRLYLSSFAKWAGRQVDD